MYKTQIFTSTNIQTLKTIMDNWFAEHATAKIISQSQSSCPNPIVQNKPLVTVTIVYQERVVTLSNKKKTKRQQLNG